jgi:hypothetical protein
MKLLKTEQWTIVIVMGLMLLSGINWGLPDRNRMTLLLSGVSLTQEQISKMNALRDEFTLERESAESLAVQSFFQGKGVTRKRYDDEPDLIMAEKYRLCALRDYILSSSAVDEMYVPQCLARMNPSKFDFDPKSYIYGGAYLYPIGAVMFISKAIGLFHAASDFSYYLYHPSEAALFYIPGRAFNILAFVSTLALLGLLGNKLSGTFSGTLSMLAYSFSTLALNYSIVSKPHICAAFWSFLALYFLYLYINDNRKRSFIISVVAAGMAVGSSLPAGVIAIIYPALLLKQKTIQKGIQKTLLALLGVGGVLLLTNPYAILSYDNYLYNIAWHGRGEQVQFAKISVRALSIYLREICLRAYSFPISLFGFAAIVWISIAGKGFVRRLAMITLFLLLFIGSSLGQTRISLFMGPILCLFSGIALGSIAVRISRRLRIGVISVLFVPGICFTILFARDTVFDDQWCKPAVDWIESSNINARTTIGVFRIPTPIDTPPFPFLNTTLVNMNRNSGNFAEPKYVVLGNYSRETVKVWDQHPMRSKYSLIYNLGYRPPYDWLIGFRERNQSRIAGFVYEHSDSVASQAATTSFRECPTEPRR